MNEYQWHGYSNGLLYRLTINTPYEIESNQAQSNKLEHRLISSILAGANCTNTQKMVTPEERAEPISTNTTACSGHRNYQHKMRI